MIVWLLVYILHDTEMTVAQYKRESHCKAGKLIVESQSWPGEVKCKMVILV